MNRDPFASLRAGSDAPYAGAASALCPACGQPKGRGYGCAVMPEVAQDAHSAKSGCFPAPAASDAMPRQEGGHGVSGERSTIYSNSVNFELSIFDLRLTFGVKPADVDWQPLVDIVMSPQHMKAFSEMLANHVRRYEAEFGPIPAAASRRAAERVDGGGE